VSTFVEHDQTPRMKPAVKGHKLLHEFVNVDMFQTIF